MEKVNLDAFLTKVTKPSRYIGTEWNAIHKEHTEDRVTFALAFPDVYEVGMSHLGTRILYHTLNDRSDVVAERVFTPWDDMAEEMRKRDIPLFALESRSPVRSFDMIGFTLQYELSYTNILQMLHLAGIPFRASDRDASHPLIVGGGPCAFNVEPLAPFFDIVHLGESEQVIHQMMDVFKQWRSEGSNDRAILLAAMSRLQGVYIPSFYEAEYNEDGTMKELKKTHMLAQDKIAKAVIADLDTAAFPTHPIVPFMEIVHDRMMLEVFRGCTRGCRFCQAGMIYRPVRERSLDELIRQTEELIEATGYDEISLTSLNTSDYSCIQDLVSHLAGKYGPEGIAISLPSSRVDSFSIQLLQEIQKTRKTGLTLAPEAGTQRMRDVINKNVSEEDYLSAVRDAFRAGWTGIKLYFMIGLPTETDEDIAGIADLANKAVSIYHEVQKEFPGRRKPLRITVSVANFVPKPGTPFQWEAQDMVDTLKRKHRQLIELIKNKAIKLNWHDADVSFLEAVFSRGDRRLADVLETAWMLGCRFDGWTEMYRHDLWMKAFADLDLDPQFYANRIRTENELLPWDHLDAGVDKEFLLLERENAIHEKTTPDCRFTSCLLCGVCQKLPVSIQQKGACTHV